MSRKTRQFNFVELMETINLKWRAAHVKYLFVLVMMSFALYLGPELQGSEALLYLKELLLLLFFAQVARKLARAVSRGGKRRNLVFANVNVHWHRKMAL